MRVRSSSPLSALAGPALVDRALGLAKKLLAGPTPEHAATALVVVGELIGCAEASPRLAEVMRLGLTPRSAPEVTLASPDALSYDLVGCQDRSLAAGGPQGFQVGLCRSFPRVAGSWLARHRDAAAVAAAKAAIGARQSSDFDPRTDMVLDGALRVLAGDRDQKTVWARLRARAT